ncbi:MAG TPA: hypothetical protein PLY93_07660 [Turneriella sp.]|nr:hypothetical protein [Turneriella sp.]
MLQKGNTSSALLFFPFEGKVQKTEIRIEPFQWDYVTVKIQNHPQAFLHKVRAWAEQSILMENSKERLKNAVHSLVALKESASELNLLLDLGSAEVGTFAELLTIAIQENAKRIDIVSASN